MDNIQQIAQFLAETSDDAVIREFLESLLTGAELETISSRWELVKMLDRGVSQREIARSMHLSLCKITRGSKELKKKNSILKRAIRRMRL
jgi:TrpR family trp operon transcriptional repressor